MNKEAKARIKINELLQEAGCIERERSIVEGNRALIRIYEEKVKKVIEMVWEG